MNPIVQDTCNSLEDLAISILNAYSNDNTMTEIWDWRYPPVTRHDLAGLLIKQSNRLKEYKGIDIDEELKEDLLQIVKRVDVFKRYSLQNLFNGNGFQVVPVFISLVEWITATINPLFSWQVLQDNKALPTNLARRLRSIQAELEELNPEKDDLAKRIQLINDAISTAETLPIDLKKLKEARDKVDKFSTDSAEIKGKIDIFYTEIQQTLKLVKDEQEKAEMFADQCKNLVDKCEEAYRITTTKGLAAAFEQRAKKLGWSIWTWVAFLIIALVAGAYIGSIRVEALLKHIDNAKPEWGIIWLNMLLAILSIGAPIWFAWLSTKQISQRFKLSEDYAFKASVAKAYEGYRKEASRIDSALEARLFSSALTRLEEAPLRLMGDETHNSPWQELISSPQFQKALQQVPEFRDKFIEVFKEGVSAIKSNKNGVEITKDKDL